MRKLLLTVALLSVGVTSVFAQEGQANLPPAGLRTGVGIRADVRTEVKDVRGEIKDARQGVREEVKGIRDDRRANVKEIRTETRDSIKDIREDARNTSTSRTDLRGQVMNEVGQMRDKVQAVRLEARQGIEAARAK